MHKDPKNNWRVPVKYIFLRFSLVPLSIHRRLRRGAERIEQQQQQQSLASAILATTQQSVPKFNKLKITRTFRSSSGFRL